MLIRFYRASSGREPVREYIDRLQRDDMEIVLRDLGFVREFGLFNVPVVTRHLKDKLWEIKTGRGRQQRLFYCVVTGPVMILLHACKKQKEGSQQEDVAVAYHRMKEVCSE